MFLLNKTKMWRWKWEEKIKYKSKWNDLGIIKHGLVQ